MNPFASDKTAVDNRLELPPLPKPKSESQLKAIQHNYTPWGDFTNSPFPQEDLLGKAYGKVASRVLFGEDSDNTNLMTGLVPGADVAIKLSEGKQPGVLDGLGDLKPLAAMLPVLKWGKELPSPKTRTGKSQRNLDKYVGEKMMPTVTRFHRTTNDAADKILDEGLRIRNENYGRFTADADEIPPMIWLANNPDRIPVMNSKFNIPGGPRMDPSVSTLKVEIPRDEYDQIKRFTQLPGPNGRRFAEVGPGEQSLFDDYATGRMHGRTKTDLIGEDISPDHISLLSKPEPGRFVDRQTNREWYRVLINDTEDNLLGLYGRLPKELRNRLINKRLTYDDAEELYRLLPSIQTPEVIGTFPGTNIPRIVSTNTPRRPDRSKMYYLEPGPIARGSDVVRNDIFKLPTRGLQHRPDPQESLYFGDNIPQYDAGKYAKSINRVKKLATDDSHPSTNVSVGAIGRGSYNLGPMSANQLEYLIRNSDDKQLRRLIDETIDPFDPPDEDDIIEFMQNIRSDDRFLKNYVKYLTHAEYGIPSSFLPDFAEDVFASKGKTMPGMFKDKESPDEVNIDPSQLTWMPLDD